MASPTTQPATREQSQKPTRDFRQEVTDSIIQIDGVDANKKHTQERCICGLLLIWNPK